ncbi:hypothetical protein D3C73_1446620 [compost metagenome]
MIAPVPDASSPLPETGPSVNWRSVLPPAPAYRSVPPFRIKLLAAAVDDPMELASPPSVKHVTSRIPALMMVDPV